MLLVTLDGSKYASVDIDGDDTASAIREKTLSAVSRPFPHASQTLGQQLTLLFPARDPRRRPVVLLSLPPSNACRRICHALNDPALGRLPRRLLCRTRGHQEHPRVADVPRRIFVAACAPAVNDDGTIEDDEAVVGEGRSRWCRRDCLSPAFGDGEQYLGPGDRRERVLRHGASWPSV